MSQSSRTFRIFISSTFSDLKAERNALQEKVLPRLRDLAASHGCRFQAIDLRWGVSEEAALDQQTMKICLGEIERCQKTSPRPNFIVLLGNRYGWQPLPYEIPAHEFEKILLLVAGQEKALLEQWYRRDDNAVPSVYCLQARSGEFVEYKAWENVENSLRQVFLVAIKKLDFSPEAALKYTASATEQEIVAGALKVPDASEHVFCFLRDIKGFPDNASAAAFCETDPQASRQQSELKARLRQALAGNVYEYNALWQGDSPSQEHLDQLCEDIYVELSKVILAEVGQMETVEPLEREIAAHEAFGKDRARVFIGRADILSAIEKQLTGNDPHPLAVWGASGSGKSALMAKAVEQAQKLGQDVLYRFIGATPESSNGRALLDSLCRQISRRYGVDESTIPAEYKDLIQEFPKRLALATPDKPLILFLDALDQLSDTDNVRELIWLPGKLPPNVHLVVSTLPGECLQTLESKLPAINRLEVQLMSVEEGKNILTEWLSGVNRQLGKKQEEYLLGKFKQCGQPLYLKLAFEEARLWKSYDALPELSGDILGILQDLFKRLSQESNHGQMMISRSLGYLAAAKNGLSEDELLDVLSLDQDVLQNFHDRSPKSPEVSRLPVVVWSRLFFDLEPYLTERAADGTSLLGFYHRQMSEACQAAYGNKACHAGLAAYFNPQPLYLKKDEQAPNLRKLSEMVYQQACAGLGAQVEQTLLDYTYLQAKLDGEGIQELVEDYTLVSKAGVSKEKEKSLSLLQGTLRISAHVLSNDPSQLPGQLIGRLLGFNENDLQGLLKQVHGEVKHPWLRPLQPCLDRPGGPLLRTLTGHTFQVLDVALSQNDRRAVSASGDGTLKIWDVATGACLLTLEGHMGLVLGVALTPDGRRAVSASGDGTLKVWDLESGESLHTLVGHTASVCDVAMTPDGRIAVSSSDDKTLRVWNVQTGDCLRKLEGHLDKVNGVALTPDGRLAVSASEDKTLKVWDLKTGECLRTMKGHTNWVSGVATMPDSRRAVSACIDGTLKVWDLQSGDCLSTLEGHNSLVNGVALTPDGRRAVSAASDKTLKMWDIETGSCLRTLEGHTDGVNGVALTSDGRCAVSASNDHTLKVWDLESDPILSKPLYMLERHKEGVEDLALIEKGHFAVSASSDKTIKVWDLESGDFLRTLEGHTGQVKGVALTPDGRHAVSASWDKTLKMWDLESGICLHTLEGHTERVNSIALTTDGRYAVSASSDKTIKVWDLESEVCLHTLKGHMEGVEDVSLTPDDRCAVSASWDKTIKVWDIESGSCLHTLEGYGIPALVARVVLAPDGNSAISTSGNHTLHVLKIWDLKSGSCINTLKGHTNAVEDLAITPDGRLAVSASWDKTLKVWDLTTGDCLHTLEGHTNRVPGVATTQDGRYAVSAAWDKTLKIWDLETGACLASFSGESAMGESGVKCAGITSDGLTIVAGDHGGAVYFLHFENAPINPLITIPDTKQNKDSSVESGKTVEQIVRELGDFYARKEYDQATRLGKELEKKCRESGNKVYQQYALGIQADIQFAIGKKEEALILYKEREQICRDLGNKEMIQSSLGQQASILYTKKDYDSALSLWKEQEKICRESGNKVGLQRTLGNLAMILSERGDLGGAMALYKEQEQICTDLEDFEGKIIAVNKQLAISKKGKLKGMIKWIISNK